MVSLSQIQRTIAQLLEHSIEFQDFCTTKVGEPLNMYTDSSTIKSSEELPYGVVHKINKAHNENEEDEWIMQLLVGILSGEKPTNDAGVEAYPSTTIVEEVADKALELINAEIGCFGIEGELNFRVANYNILISEIGEAEDVMAIVTFTVVQYALLG